MHNIIFTGAAGYIGSCSAYYFLKHTDCNVFILDNLSTGFVENIQFLESMFKDRVHFINIDLGNTIALKNFLSSNRFDCVVHFAASIVVPESVTDPISYYVNNTKNTLNLVSLCMESNIDNFIFSSTAAVYGEPSSCMVSENDLLAPINPYGSSKMMSEIILRDCSRANKSFNFVALRYFNVAGALTHSNFDSKSGLGQRCDTATHLIKVACECAVGKRERMSIFGNDYGTKDGTCIRDYIHVDDLALAHLSAYEFLITNKTSDVFNVGYGIGYSVREVIDAVKRISGVNFEVVESGRRDGDPENLVANNSKILNATNWLPKFNDLELIVKTAYLWEKSLL